MSKTTELFETITTKLISVIEDGEAGKWSKPWTTMLANAGRSINPTTKKSYQGMNELVLMATVVADGYQSNTWATYKQWQSIEANVRKGERGTKLVKWGVSEKCVPCKSKYTERCRNASHAMDRHLWASGFTVFNADQVDGYDVPAPKAIEDLGGAPEKVAEIEAFVKATGAVINHRLQDRAFYSPSTDTITLPKEEQFETTNGYYSTKLHELTHWSGGKARLAREVGNVFGDAKYAAEELVAELGATFLAAHFGIEPEPHEEHAAYLASWLRGIKDDPMSLYRAAKQAQAAVDFLLGTTEKEEVPA